MLEKSLNRTAFEDLDLQYGQGTSTVYNDYQFIYDEPLLGLNYFRLKQVDIDGSITYSDIKSVYFDHLDEEVSFVVFRILLVKNCS